jgi:hypothetical protein
MNSWGNTLNIYGQRWKHDQVIMRGDLDAFVSLKYKIDDLIDYARQNNKQTAGPIFSEHFVTSGDGFHVVLECLPPEILDKLNVPYVKRWLHECSETAGIGDS